jgi:lipid-binding SYLF domain-containing protein
VVLGISLKLSLCLVKLKRQRRFWTVFSASWLIFVSFIPSYLCTSQRILNDPNRHSMLSPKLFYSGPEVSTSISHYLLLLKSFYSGLAVFQVLKAGFVFSGKAGSGLVIARLPDGSWSAPSCIATGGLGWGLQIGADITDFVIVLNSEDAVRAFSLGGNVTIGGGISATAGPIGTGGSVQASLAHPAPMFSYSKSKGTYCKFLLHAVSKF